MGEIVDRPAESPSTEGQREVPTGEGPAADAGRLEDRPGDSPAADQVTQDGIGAPDGARGARPPACPVLIPADANVVNVRTSYGARGDGTTDDTEALQRAIGDHLNGSQIVYLPAGIYRVSNRLEWRKGTTGFSAGWGAYLRLQGEGVERTVIRLVDRAPTFGDRTAPKAVIYTASRDDQTAYDDATGPGNQAFGNFVRDLTVDVGAGNPGAIGVDFQVSNWGALREVTIRSSDPLHQGYAGVSMTRRDNGPGLLKNVTVEGFEHGMLIADGTYSLTLENITLRGQSRSGISVTDMPLSIHDLVSVNAVPALVITGSSLVDLVSAELTRGSAATAAIVTQGDAAHLFARDVSSAGYASAVNNRGTLVPGARLEEYVSDAVKHLGGAARASLNLPIQDTPVVCDPDLGRWRRAGPPSGGDDTEAIQAALDSGASTVYFPNGNYRVADTLRVPGTVKQILGFESHLLAASATRFNDAANPRPIFRFEGGDRGEPVMLEGFHTEVQGAGVIGVEHASPRTLTIRDETVGGAVVSYQSVAGAGDLFLEDVVSNLRLAHPQSVWARQLNDEQGDSLIVNAAARLWILGLKSERTGTIIETRGGGRTELLGGNLGVFGQVPPGVPAFINDGAAVSLSFTGTAFVPGFFFAELVRETRSGATMSLRPADAYWRGLGTSVPLYAGH